MLTSLFPAVLMYDLTYSAWVHRERWQPWAHWFMKDRADAMCPTVGTVKNRTRPTFHLGHTSCVYDCICMSLFYPFVYELSHCSQLWGWWSHINLAGGLWDSVGIPHFLLLLLLIENIICRDLAAKTRMKTLPHRAVKSWGERKAVVCSGMVWVWWCGFSLTDLSAVLF